MRLPRRPASLPAALAGMAVVAVAAVSGAAAREIPATGTVRALATSSLEVAYAAAQRPGCVEVRVWNTGDRGVRRYASHCFAGTSTGSGVSAVAVSRGRALWLTYTGGNIRERTLWTRSRTSRVRRIAFTATDVDDPSPIVVGTAWSDALLYALRRTLVVLAPDGSRRFSLELPERATFLSAHSGGSAAVLADGRVLEISASGAVVRTHSFEPLSVEAAVRARTGLLVKTRTGLQLRAGGTTTEVPLPRGTRFLGYVEGIAAYAQGAQLRLVRLRDGKDVRFRTLAPGFPGQLSSNGIAYARGATVSFDPLPVVRAALAG